jgi:DNA processing protein
VSGLAYGVDAAAHQAALDAGGRTVAVLGSGVDRIYPSRHTRLARAIVDGGGAVLTEFPLGTKPDATNFPRRNRIVAGLSRGVLVAEAHSTGGALITAHCALGQNREVFAVPAPLFGDVGQGANDLLKQGATLAQSADEVLAALEPQLESATPAAAPVPAPPMPVLTRAEQQVYDALTAEPLHIDLLSDAAGLDTPSLLVTLLGLEFKGLARQLAGKQFSRS